MHENITFSPSEEIIELRTRGRILFALRAAFGDDIHIKRLDELLSLAENLSDDLAERFARFYDNFTDLREQMKDAMLDCIQKEVTNG